jgi:hypothetical protein
MKRFLIMLALSAIATAACAQPAGEPTQEAAALARALSPERLLIFQVGAVEEIRSAIEQQLLNTTLAPRGPPCDPAHAECAAVARAIAAREAPAIQARRRALIERAYALYFERRMTADELRAARAFLATPSGRKLGEALSDLTGVRVDRERATEIVGTMMSEFQNFDGTTGLHDQFYDRTRHLPRRSLPFAPPPPQIPSAAERR